MKTSYFSYTVYFSGGFAIIKDFYLYVIQVLLAIKKALNSCPYLS